MAEIREECGVFGVFGKENPSIAQSVYFGLFALQHRGQESCGIAVNKDGVFTSYKDVGIVNDGRRRERERSADRGKSL